MERNRVSLMKKKQSLLRRMGRSKEQYLMLAPFIVLFAVFTLIPVLMSLPVALTNFNLVSFPKWVGLENFKRLFLEDETFLQVVRNTLFFAVFTGPVSYFLCLFLAWLINEYPPKLRAFLTLVFYAPSITGNVFIVWSYIFSGDMYGFLNAFLIKNGLINDSVQWLTNPKYSFAVVLIVQLWLSLGAGFLSFIAGLQGIDKSSYEAGAIEGIRNRWQELFYITLPSMGPQLLFGAVIQIGSSFACGAVSMQLTGFPSTDHATDTVMTYALDYGSTRYEMGYASAICFVLFCVMLLMNQLVRSVLKKYTD